MMRQIKFNRFLHPNEHPLRIFLYLGRLFGNRQKLGTFLLNKPYLKLNEIDIVIDKSSTPNSIL